MGVDDQIAARGAEPALSDEDRLARVLEALRAALEAGPILDLKTMAAEHPSIADHLRNCLNALHQAEETGRPSISIVPVSGMTAPESTLLMVDFPAPLSPTSPSTSPGLRLSEALSSDCKAP